MLLKEFYTTVVSSEAVCTQFLRNHALLGVLEDHEPCHKCGTQMIEKRRKTTAGEWVPILRCTKRGCQMRRTLRTGSFFQFTDFNIRTNFHLSLCQIMELMFMFVIDIPIRQIHELTGRAETTITAWFEVCCTVCSTILLDRQKMVGTDDQPIQIDEAWFAGCRKYN